MRYLHFGSSVWGVCVIGAMLAGCSSRGASTPSKSSLSTSQGFADSSSVTPELPSVRPGSRKVTPASEREHLYVITSGGNAGGGSIELFDKGANGNATPLSGISGASTGIDAPFSVAVDLAGNMYAANSPADSITSYTAGSSGNASPNTDLSGGNTKLGYPTGVVVDASGNIYVANPQAGYTSITVYAAGSTGNTPPVSTIRGPHTGLKFPYGVTLDSANNIYAANNSRNS